jgi:hypothetical protein
MKISVISLLIAVSSFVGLCAEAVPSSDPFSRLFVAFPTAEKAIEAHSDAKVVDAYRLRAEMKEGFLFRTVSPSPLASDAFSYELCFKIESGEFWIARTGGVAGVFELFGPIRIK